jgi:hypothetical protein
MLKDSSIISENLDEDANNEKTRILKRFKENNENSGNSGIFTQRLR